MIEGAYDITAPALMTAGAIYFAGYACLRRFCDDQSRAYLDRWGRRCGKTAALLLLFTIGYSCADLLTGWVS